MTSILIVEDDNDINNLICNTLKAEGYQCERAFDGKEGADKIEQNRYDLLLLDIMLPEINGYELLDYVRGIGDTPVIIISAMGQVDESDLLYELMKNKNVALSRRRLYELVWQEEYTGETRTLDSHVQRLRKKLDWNQKIVTVFRIGYRLEVRG